MFGYTKNTASRTDLFLLEMAREMIVAAWDIGLISFTNATWMYKKEFDPSQKHQIDGSGWIAREHPAAKLAREVTLDGVYLRQGGLQYPFKVEYILTQEDKPKVWRILRAFVYIGNRLSERRDFHFGITTKTITDAMQLRELQLRGVLLGVTNSSHGKTFLLIDDEPHFRQIWKEELEAIFPACSVFETDSLEHAESWMNKEFLASLSCVILDGKSMDGDPYHEFASVMRSKNYQGPIIAASREPELQKYMLEHGCSHEVTDKYRATDRVKEIILHGV